MIRLLVDEDFNHDILRGVVRRVATVDALTVQELGLKREVDHRLLALAAEQDRVVVTHDENTMTRFARERVRRRQRMPGLFVVHQGVSLGRAIEDLVLLVECSLEGEWEGQILFLPL